MGAVRSGRLPYYINIPKNLAADAVLSVFAFFVGRATVFGTINPVIIAYIAPFLMRGKVSVAVYALASFGIITKFNYFYSVKYLSCIAVSFLLNVSFTKHAKNIKPFVRSAVTALILLMSGILFAVFNNASVYLTVMAVLESLLAFAFGIIMSFAVSAIKGETGHAVISNEELVSVAVLIAAIVTGCADIYIGVFSLRLFSCFFITAVLAAEGGATAGAATGALLGAFMRIGGFEPAEFSIVLSLAGLVGGSMIKINKIAALASFCVSLTLCSFYFNYNVLNPEFITAVLSAAVAAFFVRRGIITTLPKQTNPVSSRAMENYSERVREVVHERLLSRAGAFDVLAKTFNKLSEKRPALTGSDAAGIVDDAAARACADCPKQKICWVENLYSTYRAAYLILENPDGDLAGCVKPDYFKAALARCFEMYKTNLSWLNKIAESRQLVGEQLSGVSGTLMELADELRAELVFDEEKENRILMELKTENIEVDGVIVLENINGLCEVTIKGNIFSRENRFVSLVSRALGRKMRITDAYPERIELAEQQRYFISSGVACEAKD
ncbi:MAG: hypothetical protein LBM16_01970 [Clostridiales bacterium]|jgi:stage II sporulation protein E|nr:hypothetical protein [Clostridiales bacterium]